MKIKILIIVAAVYAILAGNVLAYANTGDFTVYPSYTHNGSKSWIIRSSAPGSTVDEMLTLENLSADKQLITLNVKEAQTKDDKFIPLINEPYKNIGYWISLPQNSYLLSPHEKVKIPVKITIPDKTSVQQYTGVIFASKEDKTNANLNIITQIGVRVYLNVTADGAGFASIFNSPAYKSSFFFFLSLAGLSASIVYYLINHLETRKYEKKQA